MGGQADAVTRPVAEVVAVTGRDDHVPGERIGLGARRQRTAGRHGRRDPVDRGGLRTVDELVDLEVALGRLADEQRPGHVAAIARDLGPEIEQEDGPGPNRPVARRAVGQGRLGPGQAGDVEGQAVGAAGPDQDLEPPGKLGLGHARLGSPGAVPPAPDRRRCRPRRPVRARPAPSSPDRLRSSRSPGWPSGPGSAAPTSSMPGAEFGEVGPGRVAQVARLDRHPARAKRRDDLRPALPEVAVDRLDPGVGGLAAHLERVAAVGKDDQVVWHRRPDDEPARVAGDLLLAVAEDQASQVAAVLGPDAEVGVDARRRHPRPQSRQPRRPGRSIGLGPAGPVGRARNRREVGRDGQAIETLGHAPVVTSRTWPRRRDAAGRSSRRRSCRSSSPGSTGSRPSCPGRGPP